MILNNNYEQYVYGSPVVPHRVWRNFFVNTTHNNSEDKIQGGNYSKIILVVMLILLTYFVEITIKSLLLQREERAMTTSHFVIL